MANNIKTDELDQLHEYHIYTPARIITLMGDIDEDSARNFIKNIRLLDFVSDKDIKVLLATEGGDVHWGMQIYDAIKECHSRVIVHAVGPCWSMGSIIIQAADERRISASATIMIHMGKASYSEDHVLTIEQWIKEHARLEQVTQDILFEKMKKKNKKFTKNMLKKLLTFDTIFTADQAINVGLVDKIEEHKSYD